MKQVEKPYCLFRHDKFASVGSGECPTNNHRTSLSRQMQ